jgi:hypothetical protein
MAAFFCGLACLVSGVMALVLTSDLLLLGVAVSFLAALVLGVLALRKAKGHPDRSRVRKLAGWGIGLPIGGLGLAFLLLPTV